jgi:hypothetical protein
MDRNTLLVQKATTDLAEGTAQKEEMKTMLTAVEADNVQQVKMRETEKTENERVC